MYVIRKCPACNSSSSSATLTVRAKSPAEEQDLSVLKDNWRGFRADPTFFTYLRCGSCCFLYCSEYFSQSQLVELYGDMPDNTNNEDLMLLRKTQEGYQRQISKYGFKGAQILDIGADIGLLGESLQRLNPRITVDAIEPNKSVHSALQNAIGSHGRIAHSWQDLPSDARYDLITGIHVLDHLIDLKTEVEQLVNHLRPGGQIYFVTHNERSVMRRLLGRRWPPFCLQHPHLFDYRTLRRVFEDAGFGEIRIRRTTNYFSLRHIALVGVQLLGLSQKLPRFVPAIPLPLKLGNISVQGKWLG